MKSSSVKCPYCHTEMLKGHSCPGAKEDILIKLAEQRGYERAKRELSIKYGGQG